MSILCNPGIRPRHWEQMSEIAGNDLTPDSGSTLRKILKQNLTPYLELFENISAGASKVITLWINTRTIYCSSCMQLYAIKRQNTSRLFGNCSLSGIRSGEGHAEYGGGLGYGVISLSSIQGHWRVHPVLCGWDSNHAGWPDSENPNYERLSFHQAFRDRN